MGAASSASERPAHLVLGAGGVRVVSYVGVLAELADHGYTWRSISACSAGTIVGALLAAGLTAAEIAQRLLATNLVRLAGPRAALRALSLLVRPFSRYTESGAPALFREWTGGDPLFRDLKIPFATAGVDVLSNRLLVYSSDTHPEMPVAEALRIAVGIPGLYPPYEPPGRVVVDAAMATQVPVWLAAERPDDLPIIVLRPHESPARETPRALPAYVARMVESGVASRDHYLLSQIPRVRLIEPDCGAMAPDDFAEADRAKSVLIQRGRDAALEALPALEQPSLRALPGSGGSIDDRAEARAERAMAGFHHSLSRLTRDRVFISYAHADRDWLARMQTFLKPYVRYDRMDVWDDTRIAAGAQWREEIEAALRSTRVAVLLVTPDFLASDFIADKELGYFLKASKAQGLSILWVAVSHCAWDVSPIAEYQAANDPACPLDMLPESEQNRVLTEVCGKIRAATSA